MIEVLCMTYHLNHNYCFIIICNHTLDLLFVISEDLSTCIKIRPISCLKFVMRENFHCKYK